MQFVLTSRVLREMPNGFCGCIVEGRRGIGKSAYCLKVMKEVYQSLYKITDDEAYAMSLKYTLYEIEDIVRVLKEARIKKEKIPVITWDDAGVHGSSLQWFINMSQVHELKAITDTIRTAVTGFIINCTDKGGLLAHLRNYDDYIVEIIKAQPGGGNTFKKEDGTTSIYKSYERVARGYSLFKIPSGKRMVKKQFEDEYSCYIPNKHYEIYMKKRELYLDKSIKHMEELQQEKLSRHKYVKVDDQLKKIELELKAEKFKKKGYEIEMPDGEHSDA